MTRYWYDSFPGVKVNTEHPVLDFFGTPYGGPDNWIHGTNVPSRRLPPYDSLKSYNAPYTTVSQNRGGVA